MTLASLRWTEQFFSPHSNIEKKEGIVYKVFSQSENYVFLNLTMKNYVSPMFAEVNLQTQKYVN